MNDSENTITMTKEELETMLQEASKRGSKEMAEQVLEQMTQSEQDPQDEDMYHFIETFPPAEESGSLFCRSLQKMANYIASGKAMNDLQGKIDEFNTFEAKITPYYPYADELEDHDEPLTGSALACYVRKHEIYLALQREKMRRFGVFGWYQGMMPAVLNAR